MQPATDPNLWERMQLFLQGVFAPSPSLSDQRERRRAQLLGIFSVILIVYTLIEGFISGTYGIFFALTSLSLLTYILSRTKYYYIGAYLFAYSYMSLAYIRIYLNSASSIESAVSATVYISLVIASALLPQTGFALLALLTTITTFVAPIYSNIPVNAADSILRTGGIVLAMSMILYSVNAFLANLEHASSNELQDINRELDDLKTNLESRVAESASELKNINLQIKHRALRLQAVSEISQSIAVNVNQSLQELLSFITRSLNEKIGFYHVGIFLLDENREYAVLRATNSAGGKKMLDRRHQLKVGGTGIVGYVSQGGRARIALDAGTDAVFFNNPDLPETRSEMALPLKVGAQIIGVLDVQSDQPSAFNDEDVTALSTLANQIAITIQNSQSIMSGQSPASRAQTTRRGVQLNPKDRTKGFSYLPDGSISTAVEIKSPLAEKALATGETVVLEQLSKTGTPSLAVPVKLRDQVIGVIHVEAVDGKRKWTEDEIILIQAVAERAALALENASLFEVTERRATQERVVAEVTSRIGESNDMERILQTTIQELGRTLGATRTFIQLGAPSALANDSAQDMADQEEEQL